MSSVSGATAKECSIRETYGLEWGQGKPTCFLELKDCYVKDCYAEEN
jgi:hypothetical protein